MIATSSTFHPSLADAARKQGFTSSQMLDHLDKLAERVGRDLADYIKNGDIAWDGDVAKITREAEQLREFKKAALAYLLAHP